MMSEAFGVDGIRATDHPIDDGGDVYAPTTLWVGRDENGNSIITSESSILQAHDLPATRVPPPWKAIRPVKGAGTPKP